MKTTEKLISGLKRFQRPAERVLLPVLLLLWPMAAANQGVSLVDPTYSTGNYLYLGENGGSVWYFSTYLANLLGRLLTRLPGGGTLLGMNLWSSLAVAAAALSVYCLLRRLIPGWMLFLGLFVAESLCWCPTVILYNYLSYLLLTLGSLLLFLAVSSVPERKCWYLLAGGCLGLNVLVRFSNLTQAALILALWFYALISRKTFRWAAGKTLLCMLGYAAGFLAGVLPVLARYGAGAYLSGIRGLFAMTSSASDYTPASMLRDTAGAYFHALRWFAVLVPCVLAGMLFFRLPAVRRHSATARAVYIAGILVVFRFFYSRGMFTVNYQDYWCMFEWGMLFLLLTILLAVLCMAGTGAADPGERFLAAEVLVTIGILPLGSNNYTFPVLNCLFIAAPFCLWMLRRYRVFFRRSGTGFAWYAMGMALFAALLVQGALFHKNFAFGDGKDGTARSAVIEDNAYLRGMHTTPDNAGSLAELQSFLGAGGWLPEGSAREESAQGGSAREVQLLTFGNAPGLHVVFGLRPALSTTWPDLDSFPAEELRKELQALEAAGIRPLVILRSSAAAYATSESKREMLRAFLRRGDYTEIKVNEEYTVMVPIVPLDRPE